MRGRALALRIATCAVVVFATVGVGSAAASGASIQVVLQPDGTGQLVANAEGADQWSWQVCGSECAPFATGQVITTGTAPAGVTFRASSSLGATALSPTWGGAVTPASAPSVTGHVRANELLTPVAGAFNGGWAGGVDETQLAACKQPAGTECTTLTDQYYTKGCPNGAAVIDPAFTGQYLRVADRALGPDPIYPEYADSSPYGHEVWAAGPTVSVAIVGKITPATGSRTAECGPPALPAPTGSLGQNGTATVRCPERCTVVLTARRGSHVVRVTRRLERAATVSLRLPMRSVRRLGHQVTLTLQVDGELLAKRKIKGVA
jgi:hypothetical protein